MKQFGMNTYLYAPKDDVKHRAYWRDLYTVEEAGRFSVNQSSMSGLTWLTFRATILIFQKALCFDCSMMFWDVERCCWPARDNM